MFVSGLVLSKGSIGTFLNTFQEVNRIKLGEAVPLRAQKKARAVGKMASIIGQTFWKSFGKRRYLGTVKSISPKEDPSDSKEEDYYFVLYEDGDSEELTLDEVKDALAAQFNPNDDVSIEYDGEWLDGKVFKWVESGLRVIFDVDKSSTVIKLSEIRHRLKLRWL